MGDISFVHFITDSDVFTGEPTAYRKPQEFGESNGAVGGVKY